MCRTALPWNVVWGYSGGSLRCNLAASCADALFRFEEQPGAFARPAPSFRSLLKATMADYFAADFCPTTRRSRTYQLCNRGCLFLNYTLYMEYLEKQTTVNRTNRSIVEVAPLSPSDDHLTMILPALSVPSRASLFYSSDTCGLK